jgi:hypothetical protein
MAVDISPEYFADQFLEQVTSTQVRNQDGRQFAFRADDLKVQDPTDTSKVITFDASALTTATERIVSFPDRALTLGSSVNARVPVLTGASVLTLTEAHSGQLIACGAAEDFVLPTITSSNLGLRYEFVVKTTATSLTVTAAAAQLLHGGVSIMSTSAGAENDAFSADGTDDLIFTMNGTTQGGIIGSHVIFWAQSTTAWIVTGNLIGSGTLVTPFS